MTVLDLLYQIIAKCRAREIALDDTVFYFSGDEEVVVASAIERGQHLRRGKKHGVELK